MVLVMKLFGKALEKCPIIRLLIPYITHAHRTILHITLFGEAIITPATYLRLLIDSEKHVAIITTLLFKTSKY